MTRPDSRHHLRVEVRAAADVLRREWDPIGGGELEGLPADEYDSYAPHIVGMLTDGRPDSDIALYLNHLKTDVIELPSGRDLVLIARRLRLAVDSAHSHGT